ncbi:MAG: hypothetical protein LW838_02180 [Nitrosomonadaceae bacterium]|jgi:hypothetical protein|nr:hypothetical protein [Nitrosomonadaceae bacterium]
MAKPAKDDFQNADDPPSPARFWFGVAIRVAIAAGLSYYAYRSGGGGQNSLILVVMSIPLWGVILAKPILEFVGSYFDWAKREPYAKWQGRYYEFYGTHVRAEEDDEQIWFMERDLLKMLGRKPEKTNKLSYGEGNYREIRPGVLLLSESAVVALASRSHHPDAGKLRFWLEREVIAPHRKRRELGNRPQLW